MAGALTTYTICLKSKCVKIIVATSNGKTVNGSWHFATVRSWSLLRSCSSCCADQHVSFKEQVDEDDPLLRMYQPCAVDDL